MRKKIVLIGAGSSMFTQGLVMDIINNPGKNSWTLALVDIDPLALEPITKMVRKMIDGRQADIELLSSTDRREVLPGADYVITTIGVGGRRAWEQDVFIPRKYGVLQPVGDTAMPGGISRAMRMIPAMLDIVRDVRKLCPNAHLINYSNPMAIICRAIRKAENYPMTGLCIGTTDSEREIAEFAGLDPSRVTSYAAGVNHLTFIYDFRYDGEDAWPIVRKKFDEKYAGLSGEQIIEKYSTKGTFGYSQTGEPFSWSFWNTYGVYPAPGDRHISEYFTERFPAGNYYGKKLGFDAYSFEGTIKMGDDIFDDMKKTANSPEPLENEFYSHAGGEQELLMEIINSIEDDARKVFYANVPNNGAIPNLPDSAVLEMPAIATAKGLLPVHLNDYPDFLAGIICKYLGIIEVVVDAALNGDRRLFEEAILMGGYISDKNAVHKMVEELISAQKQYLPQF
jgi:alpha-galactosidase